MFMTTKGERPTWLLAHDNDVTYTLAAPDQAKRPTHTVPSHEFFSTHREATADELEEHQPAAPAPKPAPAAKAAGGTAPPPTPEKAAGDKPAAGSHGSAAGEPHGESGRATK